MNFYIYGGNEQSTHKYISELLGKETIDINTYNKSTGKSGNYSTNYQINGRELMTPDEVRLLDNKYALLFIRGERPVLDLKYDILKHPNIAFTADGKAQDYIHGGTENSIASIVINENTVENFNEAQDIQELKITEDATKYQLLTGEEIDELIIKDEI